MIKYAILADHARVDGEAAHLLGAGPHVLVLQLPVARPFALLVEALFTEQECGRDHRIDVDFTAPSLQRLLAISVQTTPVWPQERPPGGLVRSVFAINALMPLSEEGDHQVVLRQDDEDPYVIHYSVRAEQSPAAAQS